MEELNAEKIVYLFELVKDTKGKDWRHNKTKLIKIINELVEQEVKKLNKPHVIGSFTPSINSELGKTIIISANNKSDCHVRGK